MKALKLKQVIAEKAKENIKTGGAAGGVLHGKGCQTFDNPLEPIRVNAEIAKRAGVSHEQVRKVVRMFGRAAGVTAMQSHAFFFGVFFAGLAAACSAAASTSAIAKSRSHVVEGFPAAAATDSIDAFSSAVTRIERRLSFRSSSLSGGRPAGGIGYFPFRDIFGRPAIDIDYRSTNNTAVGQQLNPSRK